MPLIFLIIACALWGLSFPLVRALHLEQEQRLPGTPSAFFAAWLQVVRFALAAILLLIPLLRRAPITRMELRQGLLLGLWGGLGMGLQADALAHTDASTSAFLTQAYCVFLPLWLCLRRRAWPTARTLVATVMVLAGGAILSGLRPDNLRLGRGELETLGAALLFTFQILALENPRYELAPKVRPLMG
jgi:drug/metabolite transporter (DMT)-like permease